MFEYRPKERLPVLLKAYKYLKTHDVGDLVIYGSQSLSLYTGIMLDSKDIDLVGSLTLEQLRGLSIELYGSERFEVRRINNVLIMTTYAKIHDKVIAVEIFSETTLGPVMKFPEYITEVSYKGEKLWVITPEMYIACKLAYKYGLNERDVERVNTAAEYINISRFKILLDNAGVTDLIKRNIEDIIKRNMKIDKRIVYAVTQGMEL